METATRPLSGAHRTAPPNPGTPRSHPKSREAPPTGGAGQRRTSGDDGGGGEEQEEQREEGRSAAAVRRGAAVLRASRHLRHLLRSARRAGT